MSERQPWRLIPAPQGGLYAAIAAGDRVKLLFEATASVGGTGGGPPEALWAQVTAIDRPGELQLEAVVLDRPAVVPVSRGQTVRFDQRHVLDWRRAGARSPLALLAQWWRQRTNQTD